MADTAPKVLPPRPVDTIDQLTAEHLMMGGQLAALAREVKMPASVYRPRERGPGLEERPLDEQKMFFRVRSRAQEGTWFTFLTGINWRGLYIPKELAPPDMLLDPFYQNFAEILKPHEIRSEYHIRTRAKQIILEHEGFANDFSEDKHRLKSFIIYGKSGLPFKFYSRDDWHGLVAPRRVVPNAQLGAPELAYIPVYFEHELQGRTKVRKAARELIENYEAMVATQQKKYTYFKQSINLNDHYAAIWQTIQAMLAYCDEPSGPTYVAKWLMETVKDRIPDQDQWDELRKQKLAERKKKLKKQLYGKGTPDPA